MEKRKGMERKEKEVKKQELRRENERTNEKNQKKISIREGRKGTEERRK